MSSVFRMQADPIFQISKCYPIEVGIFHFLPKCELPQPTNELKWCIHFTPTDSHPETLDFLCQLDIVRKRLQSATAIGNLDTTLATAKQYIHNLGALFKELSDHKKEYKHTTTTTPIVSIWKPGLTLNRGIILGSRYTYLFEYCMTLALCGIASYLAGIRSTICDKMPEAQSHFTHAAAYMHTVTVTRNAWESVPENIPPEIRTSEAFEQMFRSLVLIVANIRAHRQHESNAKDIMQSISPITHLLAHCIETLLQDTTHYNSIGQEALTTIDNWINRIHLLHGNMCILRTLNYAAYYAKYAPILKGPEIALAKTISTTEHVDRELSRQGQIPEALASAYKKLVKVRNLLTQDCHRMNINEINRNHNEDTISEQEQRPPIGPQCINKCNPIVLHLVKQ